MQHQQLPKPLPPPPPPGILHRIPLLLPQVRLHPVPHQPAPEFHLRVQRLQEMVVSIPSFIICIGSKVNTQTVIITTRSGQIVTLTQQITNAGQSTLVTSTSTIIIDATNNHHGPLSAGVIAGVAIGALAILALLIAGCFVLKRRRGRSPGHQILENNEVEMRQAAPTGRCVYLALSSFLEMLISPIY